MDGPVVTAAKRALEAKDVSIALAFVAKDGEDEVTRAFEPGSNRQDSNTAR